MNKCFIIHQWTRVLNWITWIAQWISLTEVCTAIGLLRSVRTACPDDIYPEMLKAALDPMSVSLHALIKIVCNTGLVPSEKHNGIIVSSYNGKGSRAECSSYRPITFHSVPGKVFSHVLLARLKPLVDRHQRYSSQDAPVAHLRWMPYCHYAFSPRSTENSPILFMVSLTLFCWYTYSTPRCDYQLYIHLYYYATKANQNNINNNNIYLLKSNFKVIEV